MTRIVPGSEPRLEIGDVTVTRRDIEFLETVDRIGSMHGAAADLGRSYARVHARLDALEAAVGPMTDRRRGGTDGGGTELTAQAFALCRRFERLASVLEGATTVEDTVIPGTVLDRDGELGTVQTAAGPMRALVPADGDTVELTIHADGVVLTDPSADPPAEDTSLRNRFAGTIETRRAGAEIDRLTVDIGGDLSLRAVVTRESTEYLDLEPGRSIVASFKATAARGIAIGDRESS